MAGLPAPALNAGPQAAQTTAEDAAYRKLTWLLLPFLMLCYALAAVLVAGACAVLCVPARLVDR